MNILFVIHSCDPVINDNAYVPLSLGELGNNVLVISSRYIKSLKGEVISKYEEKYNNTEFYRPFEKWTDFRKRPNLHWQEIRNKLNAFDPDVVICFGELNYKLAVKISKRYKIDLHLYVEYLRPDKFAPPVKGITILRKYFKPIYRYISRSFIKYLSKHIKSLMYAYYGDSPYEGQYNKYGLKVNQVHWCTELSQYRKSDTRDMDSCVYIGSLEKFKNSGKLSEIIPIVLDHTRINKFTVIGPGECSESIKGLVEKYQGKLVYKKSVPRSEAIKIISSSGMAFTPVSDCGLGFIGDSWGCGTPLVVMHDLDGFLIPGEDVIKLECLEDIVSVVNHELYNTKIWNKYSESGLMKYEKIFSSKAVSRQILEIIGNV